VTTPGRADRRRAPGAWASAALGALLVAAPLATACEGAGDVEAREAAVMTGGAPSRGPALLRKYGCQTGHTIPGVDGADGLVGPPLDGIASRSYIAGVLTNAPANMIRWISDPKAVDPLTAMPNTGVSPVDARDIAAYLYTLR
jgi:cytochrome c2